MGQSILLITQLLTGGFLDVNELDPIRRYSPSYDRNRKVGRYSVFQVNSLIENWNIIISISLKLLYFCSFFSFFLFHYFIFQGKLYVI